MLRRFQYFSGHDVSYETSFFLVLPLSDYPPLLFLLVRYSTTRTFTRTSICFRTLTANRQAATMTNTAIAADFDQTFDVQRDFTTKIAFHLNRFVDRIREVC